MTKSKREEMTKYRNEAVLIENTIKQKKVAEQSKFNKFEADSESTVDNDYLRVSNLYRQPIAKKNRNMQLDLSTNNLSSSANLQKSDTFIYDVVSNTLTNSLKTPSESLTDEEELKQSTSSSSIISMISNLNITSVDSNTISPIPTIEINPPTPSVLKKDLSEYSKPAVEIPLIRSNSFTLESPSTVQLLQQIKRQKNVQRRKSTATNDTIESKAKKVTKSPLMISASIGNMSLRGKRSPYDSRTIKINRKKVVSLSKIRTSSKVTIPLDPLKNVEETHRQKFMELLQKQKQEQKELQNNFEIQQKLLMEELTKEISSNKLVIKSPISVESSPTFRKSYSDSSELEKKTPRRKLFACSSPDNTLVKRRVSFQ